MQSVETIPVLDVAKALHTTHGKVLAGMLNGTLPIGTVVQEKNGRRRGIVIKARWEAWVSASDLKHASGGVEYKENDNETADHSKP